MSVDMQLYDSALWPIIRDKCWKTKAPMVNYEGRFTVTAKARCSSEDSFDETIGKRIAESRAKAKAFKIAKNVWSCIAEDFKNASRKAEEMMQNCDTVENIEKRHIKKLSE